MSNSSDATALIQPTTKTVKVSECQNIDILSDLPDCVILHILSFLNAKEAVRTCVLSSRWKDLWKCLPDLKLHSSHFRTIKIFTKFVSRVLSLRDSSIALHALDLNRKGCIEPRLLKRIVNYAVSHNIQRLGLYFNCDIAQIPPTIFSCQTLTYLNLSVFPIGKIPFFPKSLNLPALTTFHLQNFAFCADHDGRAEPFSDLSRLDSLVLCDCSVRDGIFLCISSPTLVNFTVRSRFYDFYEIELCTPSLVSFAFIGKPCQIISRSSLSSVKYVDIDAEMLDMDTKHPLILLSSLLGLVNTKSLTVTASTLQVLSLYPDLFEIKLPSLGNLKSLKVKMKPLSYELRKILVYTKLQKIKSRKEAAELEKAYKAGLEPSSIIPEGIVEFLLQNSPSAEVDIVDWSWSNAHSIT